jgi:hypothetical protein
LTTQTIDADNVIGPPHRFGDEAMHLTISLDEPLAEQLRRRASANDVSPEQAATELLGRALHRIAEEEAWGCSNQRRGELIQKSRSVGLTPEESRELDHLQAALDQRLEAMDRRLLDMTEGFRQAKGDLLEQEFLNDLAARRQADFEQTLREHEREDRPCSGSSWTPTT